MQRRPAKPQLLSVVHLVALAAGQIDQGETEVINIRETDERLGPLVFVLVGLGCGALVSTIIFWWLTRPGRLRTTLHDEPTNQGDG